MAIVRYTKKRPEIYRPKNRVAQRRALERRVLFLHRLAPLFLVGVGIFLLGSVMIPILAPQSYTGQDFRVDAREETLQPLRVRENLLPTPLPTPLVVADSLDYTDLTNWFPEHVLPVIAPQDAKRYTLSIPKLGIEAAEVVYGGKNLDQHVIQYPGTAHPGEYGAPVLFGHSILRQFYNPKKDNPRRYISIFSTIMTLKNGDLIEIEDDGVKYRYRVVHKTEVKPDDLFILEQQLDRRELKLVTCTPEGTTLRRGVVTALLDEEGI